MRSAEDVAQLFQGQLPGLLGIAFTEVTKKRVSAECTPFHCGRTTMVWQTQIKTEAGKLCAVVTQTQLVLNR